MANEFKISTQITYANGQLDFVYQPTVLQLPQATQGYFTDTVTATSAEADVSLNVTTPGMMILQSLEATTTGTSVDYGAKSSTGGIGNPLGTLGPKDIHVLRFNSTSTLRIQNAGAAAGNVNVHVICFEQ